MKVEFAMQEGFLIDSFYLDSGVLLTSIYFLITKNCVINLSPDCACHPNEWIRILSIKNQTGGGKVILVLITRLACFPCTHSLLPPLFVSSVPVSSHSKLPPPVTVFQDLEI